MKKLYLIRHAKSSWEEAVEDKRRPLSERGIKDAQLVSSEIIQFLPKSFIVWCSPAKRTTETARIFLQKMFYSLDNIIFKDDLYTFDMNQLMKTIKSCDNVYDSIILFGHNSAITDFVNKFGDTFIENIPTSGFVSINFEIDSWMDLKKGKTKRIVFPKDLKNK
ncbi:MAG: SixA phosphatase family protein [Flavobacterium sp.]